jgi:hypothetical protein
VSPALDPRAGWSMTIRDSRSEIEDVLHDSPSLRREIDGIIAQELNVAAKFAAADLQQHGEPAEAVWAQLAKGGFTAEQVLGEWLPEASG